MDRLSEVPSSSPDGQVERRGRSGPRSPRGCLTCRTKKVKCDETLPVCKRCTRLKLLCDYRPRPRRNARLTSSLALRVRDQDDGHQSQQQSSADSGLHSWTQQMLSLRARASQVPAYLPELASSACSLNLSSADHEAIRYFRTTFAKIHHTKNPDYSLFSIIFRIAEREAIAMCVLLALASREMEFRSHHASLRTSMTYKPLQYYAAAISLLKAAVDSNDAGSQLDLDTICTVMYLILVYEQKYGEGKSLVPTHLIGTAAILEQRCQNVPLLIEDIEASKPVVLMHGSSSGGAGKLSLYSARILVWIGIFDSSAATYGLGGHFNKALRRIFQQHGVEPSSPVEDFRSLHNFTNPLYRNMWADSYPQSELLDDVENRAIYSLLADASQLRFLVAELGEMGEDEARKQTLAVRSAILKVGRRYCELLEVAAELSASTDNSQRLVDNIRAIVPQYHAVVLEFIRTAHPGIPEVEGMKSSIPSRIRAIMTLAHQTFKYGSHQTLTRVAWPLYVVALITEDQIYRDWIIDRFEGMSGFGKNLERAYLFLVKAMEMEAHRGRLDTRTLFECGDVEMFVI